MKHFPFTQQQWCLLLQCVEKCCLPVNTQVPATGYKTRWSVHQHLSYRFWNLPLVEQLKDQGVEKYTEFRVRETAVWIRVLHISSSNILGIFSSFIKCSKHWPPSWVKMTWISSVNNADESIWHKAGRWDSIAALWYWGSRKETEVIYLIFVTLFHLQEDGVEREESRR